MKFKRSYIKVGPYQPILSEYPASNSKKHPRYFQPSWFKQFSYNPSSSFGSTTFTHNGFSNWKKVHDGCNCAFLTHMGKDLNLLHNNAQRAYVDLMNQAQHIEVSLDRQTTQQISANRLRLKTRCAFRGHDESSGSKNCGNFLEFLSLLASYCGKVEDILKSAPKNASYTSSTIQKEILQIYANRVRNVIREEIGDRKFSIIMDEARDKSKKEQMTIILKFADKQRQVKEQFFDIVHVKYIASLTLKNVIFNVLLQHSFDIQNFRGQGYDGASNIRGEFNVLQALILNDCRYAYYVHCFAHPQAVEITRLVSINELATGTRMNQIGTLQRPGETRWSSHLNLVTSLLKMYNATSTILENLKNTASNYSQRGGVHKTYNRLRYFEFIFILHMMKEVLGITDNLCQALQRPSQDILNAMSLVLTTKGLIQNLKDDGWNELVKNVIYFCETWELDFPDMNVQYIVGCSYNKKEDVTVEHHYQVDIFFATIDTQLQELKSRFYENVAELLTFTTALDHKELFKLFDINKICILVNKFYLEDFSQQEKECLPYELKHYELDVCKHPNMRKISTLSELCKSLVENGKSVMYPLVDRLICLILTLPKEIAEKFDINEIIDYFSEVKDRRV
uniref:TTF-type domain-containing protein n=1 Tax=Gossypium raimondii TaxID=29730 RepID=A0A0D2RPH7_GOSRA|nr:hypothetical protein B456_011G186900 [Gossypium raimondii]